MACGVAPGQGSEDSPGQLRLERQEGKRAPGVQEASQALWPSLKWYIQVITQIPGPMKGKPDYSFLAYSSQTLAGAGSLKTTSPGQTSVRVPWGRAFRVYAVSKQTWSRSPSTSLLPLHLKTVERALASNVLTSANR